PTQTPAGVGPGTEARASPSTRTSARSRGSHRAAVLSKYGSGSRPYVRPPSSAFPPSPDEPNWGFRAEPEATLPLRRGGNENHHARTHEVMEALGVLASHRQGDRR